MASCSMALMVAQYLIKSFSGHVSAICASQPSSNKIWSLYTMRTARPASISALDPSRGSQTSNKSDDAYGGFWSTSNPSAAKRLESVLSAVHTYIQHCDQYSDTLMIVVCARTLIADCAAYHEPNIDEAKQQSFRLPTLPNHPGSACSVARLVSTIGGSNTTRGSNRVCRFACSYLPKQMASSIPSNLSWLEMFRVLPAYRTTMSRCRFVCNHQCTGMPYHPVV
jgi:hypothetical protein